MSLLQRVYPPGAGPLNEKGMPHGAASPSTISCTGDDQTIARSACYIRMQPLGQAVFCEQPRVQSKYMVSPQRSGL